MTATITTGDLAATTLPAAVDLRGAVSVVGGFPLLTGVDLRVDRGEVVLVSGPNGAGKTSLLRLLAGLLPLTEGTAVVLGHDLGRDRRAHWSRVALVGQETGCYDDLTVERNLRLHAHAAGVPPALARHAVAELGLSGLLSVPHGRLSTGQQRRCALAVGLSRRPDLLLLDEPLAGLDADGRDVVDRAVATAVAGGSTVLIASHDLDRVRAVADREVLVAGGRVVASGSK